MSWPNSPATAGGLPRSGGAGHAGRAGRGSGCRGQRGFTSGGTNCLTRRGQIGSSPPFRRRLAESPAAPVVTSRRLGDQTAPGNGGPRGREKGPDARSGPMAVGSAGNLAGFDAARANVKAHRGAVDFGSHPLNVRIPTPLGPAMRVGHAVAKAWLLAADFALGSHDETPEGPGLVPRPARGQPGHISACLSPSPIAPL
jgi:hypothetical protein